MLLVLLLTGLLSLTEISLILAQMSIYEISYLFYYEPFSKSDNCITKNRTKPYSRGTKQGSSKSRKEKLLEKREKEKKIIRREIGKMKSNIAKFQNRAGNALF